MRPLAARPVTKTSSIMMTTARTTTTTPTMIGIFWLAIIFSLSAAGQEIDSVDGRSGDSNSTGAGDDKLQVTIYYETLCYDSVSFITNQLVPAWQKHRDQMSLKLVPFGKSYIDETIPTDPVYYCQHGRRECSLNMLHGCILDKLPLEKAFPVVACLMKGTRTSFDQCIKKEPKEAKDDIMDCVNNGLGAQLYKGFQKETNRVATPLAFVPTIEVDMDSDIFEQDRWLYRFDQTFRQKYEAKFKRSLN